MIPETTSLNLVIIYFFYGLAFFSLGLAIILEGWRSSDARLRLALRPLAAFGLIHGLHDGFAELVATFSVSSRSSHAAWRRSCFPLLTSS